MMKRLLMMAFAATTLATSIVPANAQFSYGVNGEEARLQSRIDAGVRTGALTRGEASRLQSKLNQLRDLSYRMRMTGGRMNFAERDRLQNKLNNLNQDINRQLTDLDRNFGGGYRRGPWHR